jgi:hypothetical protein
MKIEDVSVDIFTLSSPTQMILAWTLLGALLAWLVIFAVLSLRGRHMEQIDWDDLPTPGGSFPAITRQVIHQQSSLAQMGMHASSAHTTAAPVNSHSGRAPQQTDHSD